MDATVEWPIRTREVAEKDVQFWTNREALPVMRQMRQALNQQYTGRFTHQTAGTGTLETIWTSSDMAVGKVWLVDATIMARATGARSAWIIRGLFYNDGTVTQEGATTAVYTQSAAAFSVAMGTSANHLLVEVQDDGVLTVQWQAWIELREHPQ